MAVLTMDSLPVGEGKVVPDTVLMGEVVMDREEVELEVALEKGVAMGGLVG